MGLTLLIKLVRVFIFNLMRSSRRMDLNGADLGVLIMDVKFKSEKKTGSLMSWGQNFPFPIDFACGPYRSAVLERCR